MDWISDFPLKVVPTLSKHLATPLQFADIYFKFVKALLVPTFPCDFDRIFLDY